MFDWLDNTVIKLCTMPPVGTDLNTVKDQLNEMKVCPWDGFEERTASFLGFVCFVLGVRGGGCCRLFCLLAVLGPVRVAVAVFSSCGESGARVLVVEHRLQF